MAKDYPWIREACRLLNYVLTGLKINPVNVTFTSKKWPVSSLRITGG